jgi:FtsZ-interacting cell division protein ZipA
MATSTLIIVVVAAVVVIAILIALMALLRRQRTERQRSQASEMRDAATAQEHTVGRREALADETDARARIAAAEADAKTAHAAGLQHQAQERRNGAKSARDEVNEQFQRADTLDPNTHDDNPPRRDRTASR